MGVVVTANGDARRTINGEVINFLVHYEVDNDTSSHVLKLEHYGKNAVNAWVLLEREGEDGVCHWICGALRTMRRWMPGLWVALICG